MTTQIDKTLGRYVWKVLHAIAINFPDGPGLTKQRQQAYFNFFNSLKYVLPRKEWRNMWHLVTASGETELDWNNFEKVRDHRIISRWLFAVHDTVRRNLKQSEFKNYEKLYDGYKKYREGYKGKGNASSTDSTGLGRLRTMVRKRPKAIDRYLEHIYGSDEVGTWSRSKLLDQRKLHLDDATEWYWDTLRSQASNVVKGFNRRTIEEQRTRILTMFDHEFKMRIPRLYNAVKTFPGRLKNTLLA